MSTLLLNTLTGKTSAGSIVVTGEGGSTTTNLQQGVAKAWVDFDGSSTATIRDSYNIASLTDQGTGQYQFAITNDMSSQYFSIATNTGNRDSSNAGITRSSQGGSGAAGTFHCEIMEDGGNANTDAAAAQALIHGDLA